MSDSATPQTAACSASLSLTVSWSLLKPMSIESVMLANHLILFCPLLPLPSAFPSQHWCLVFRARKSSSCGLTEREHARRTEEGVTGKLCHRHKHLELIVSFLFFNVVIYLFVFGCSGPSLLLRRPSLVVASRGCSSHLVGLLTAIASLVMEHRLEGTQVQWLWYTDSVALQHVRSSQTRD